MEGDTREMLGEENDPFNGIDNLRKNENIFKRHLKLLIVVALIIILAIVIILIVIKNSDSSSNSSSEKKEIEYEISTVKIPSDILLYFAHYLPNGDIFLIYFNNTKYPNNTCFGTISDNGENFNEILCVNYTDAYKSNGKRGLPFSDNKKVLIGDYILECTEELSKCKDGKLILIEYPTQLVNRSTIMCLWSEPIISPDDKYLAWTSLDTQFQSMNLIAKIIRSETTYKLEDIKCISSNMFDGYNKETKILTPGLIRGGELKQFVDGGNAITEAGAVDYGLVRSIYQNLNNESIYPLSYVPGYDETTIISPDEKLGITMSTRFSDNTNLAIIGLLPIPHSIYATSRIIQNAYSFSIEHVRNEKNNNGTIGPVLIEINKSVNDKNYVGQNLHVENGWNFCSPISWHQSSKKGIFLEIEKMRDDGKEQERRIRLVNLKNYEPAEIKKEKKTPENIPYAISMEEALNKETPLTLDGKIEGKNGEIIFDMNPLNIKLTYNNYSEDNLTFYNGNILYNMEYSTGENSYQVNVTMTGKETGNSDFRLTFDSTSHLLYDMGTDLKPKTYGYSTYGDKKIDVSIYKQE